MSSRRAVLLMLMGMLSAGPIAATGLYDESTYRSLVSDHRAHRVGDILTVVVYESASAESSTDANTRKSLGVGLSASDGFNSINGNLDVNNDFEGGGTLSRTDQVAARVSVTVTEVLPGGDLKVHGQQRIEFNQEIQFISVEGRVRPVDISLDNVVMSSRLADARINYTGDGLLTDRQDPGWLTRFFNWLF